MLHLAGYDIRIGMPSDGDMVGIWGNSPTAHRGLSIAEKKQVPVLRVEDAFLRSLHPGRSGNAPLGLLLDRAGVHFDPSVPSDLEEILAKNPLDDSALLDRARDAMSRIQESHLSKYTAFEPDQPVPRPGYVLVVDQTRGDASVTASGADRADFIEMLVFAQEENPGAKILIKTHPETVAGYRAGYFDETDASDRVTLFTETVSPWNLLQGAVGVYTMSSQLGFEAVLAGHKPRVFGQPFYAGWGLTQDENPVPRRERRLTRPQLFAAAMILYPIWYDPYRDRLCEIEDVLATLEAQSRAWREDHLGWVASGMRLWKRNHLQKMFGREKRVVFSDDIQNRRPDGRRHMAWASKLPEPTGTMTRVEDGFLRSRGLGAELVPPLSLITDEKGIYYDPRHPSRLEDLIAKRSTLTAGQERRAERLISSLVSQKLNKYNLGGDLPDLPEGRRILVSGQVEDDASILTGGGAIRDNLALLQEVRAAAPEAIIIYKPHPDVEASLRKGAIEAGPLADVIAINTDAAALLGMVDEVWTMTSLLGFEALLRGLPVTTFGAPFYAGWGLTRDLGETPDRRRARPSLNGLVHAALIDYPRYWDPVTGLPCPVEVIVERLASGDIPTPGPFNRTISKLQGLFASASPWWR
ncbi:capsular polysaccharide biosynthesis protein [Sulfitobacter sp. BDSS02]|nr:capsular polysaccharide biosynthesis protein [Sulfitobacter sp. BDSS02]MBR9851629.1 capsular polysaccharide biosynthesis protein [Paracoccaceae bacterium]